MIQINLKRDKTEFNDLFEHKGIKCKINILFAYMDNGKNIFNRVLLEEIGGPNKHRYIFKDEEASLHLENAEIFCDKILKLKEQL